MSTLMERLNRLDAVCRKLQDIRPKLSDKYSPLVEQLLLDARELKGNRAFADDGRVERLEKAAAALNPAQDVSVAMAPVAIAGGLHDSAMSLCQLVLARAAQQNLPAAVAICDGAGQSVAMLAAPGAFLVSPQVAANKAYTAAALHMSTLEVGMLTQPGGDFYGLSNQDPKIVCFGGGVPLMRNGALVGAIGVSGGTSQADHALAEYGAECFVKGV